MRCTMILVLVIGLVSASAAQTDSGQNGIGIYFDEGATLNAINSETEIPVVHGYLVLTRPSESGYLAYWRARIQSPDTPPDVIYGIPRNGANLAVPMPGSDSWYFRVDCGEPGCLLLGDIAVLADVYVEPNHDRSPIYLYVVDMAVYSIASEEGPLVAMTPSSGSAELPVASIDGIGPVPGIASTWGSIKAIYR